ncbi:hypothetical protein C8J57DRAFT_1366596 [Mycena rebaudengoi]|nr:hypothetical protein C8J57DRAFT_1366596 [Mycena rebaudengoi]
MPSEPSPISNNNSRPGPVASSSAPTPRQSKRAIFMTIGSLPCSLPDFPQTHCLLSAVVNGFAHAKSPFDSLYDALFIRVSCGLARKYVSEKQALLDNASRKTFREYISSPGFEVCLSDFLPSQPEKYAWGLTNPHITRRHEVGFCIPALRADLCTAYEDTFASAAPSQELLNRRALLSTLLTLTLVHEITHSWLRFAVGSCAPPEWVTPPMENSQDPGGQSGRQFEAEVFGGTVFVIWPEDGFGDFARIENLGFSNSILCIYQHLPGAIPNHRCHHCVP